MTLAELLEHIDQNTDLPALDGDAQATFDKALQGTHRAEVIGEVIRSVVERNACEDPQCELERANVVTPIGPIRLKYMADDAPVEGFRMVENFIRAVDDAFNDEALRRRKEG